VVLLPNTLGAAYPVRLPVFEGPLDLLLHLIEREELDITAVSLVAVTDSYLQALRTLETIEPGALAEFLVVAAKLLYLKSRSLLPQPSPPEDEEEEDPGQALVRQLLEYRRYKEVAQGLQARQEAGLRAFVRTAPPPHLERKLDLADLTVERLAMAVHRALERMPSSPPSPALQGYRITLAEAMDRVRDRLRCRAPEPHTGLPFSAFLAECRTRREVVLLFLAVLEMFKQREILVEQAEVFGEIFLRLPSPELGHDPDETPIQA